MQFSVYIFELFGYCYGFVSEFFNKTVFPDVVSEMYGRNQQNFRMSISCLDMIQQLFNFFSDNVSRDAVNRFAVIDSQHKNDQIYRVMGFQNHRKQIGCISSGAENIIKNGSPATKFLFYKMMVYR